MSAAELQTLGSSSGTVSHPRYENPINLWNRNIWTKEAEWNDTDWATVSRQEPPGHSCWVGTGEAQTPEQWWLGWPQGTLQASLALRVPVLGCIQGNVSRVAVKLWRFLQRHTKKQRYYMLWNKLFIHYEYVLLSLANKKLIGWYLGRKRLSAKTRLGDFWEKEGQSHVDSCNSRVVPSSSDIWPVWPFCFFRPVNAPLCAY